jgi:3-oxoacyl-[acyl-carrier protein] reductase
MADRAVLQLPAALSLAGQRVVVTGASRGIGFATAVAVAGLGAEVVLNDLAPLARTREAIEAVGGSCTEAPGDLTADGFVASLLGGGRVHAVAHCAGILDPKPWQDDPNWAERFHRIMEINARIPLAIGAACIEHMGAHGGGRVVLVGSLAGRTGGTSLNTPPDYAASKGAVHTLVRWLSRQGVGKGVLINAVAPGPVETRMTRGIDLQSGLLPMGRLGTPEELGWTIAFLCTPAAGFITGAVLDVNGGGFVG